MLRQILVSINMLEVTFFRNTGLGLSKSKTFNQLIMKTFIKIKLNLH